jgi:sporulation-control protein spo0M
MTAIEWLANRLPSIDFEDDPYYRGLFNIAKELEKRQIIDAYENGYSDSDNTFELNENYYNEIFNK